MRERPNVSVIHELPYRVHVRAPQLAGHRDACGRVARLLAQHARWERVRVRPVTGSVIIESDDALDARAIANRLREIVAKEVGDDGLPLTARRHEREPGPTRVAHAVAHAFVAINADVRAALDDRADIGTILPIVLATVGVAEVVVTKRLPAPPWFNVLWWSLRSFMTFNVRAVQEEDSATEESVARPNGHSESR